MSLYLSSNSLKHKIKNRSLVKPKLRECIIHGRPKIRLVADVLRSLPGGLPERIPAIASVLGLDVLSRTVMDYIVAPRSDL